MPPVAGLWSGSAAMIGYALFGPSRHLLVGPEAGTAMMAFMVGVALVIAGCFRLGAISDFLSRPILVGYINGLALALIASQFPGAPGIVRDLLPCRVASAEAPGLGPRARS